MDNDDPIIEAAHIARSAKVQVAEKYANVVGFAVVVGLVLGLVAVLHG